MIRHRLFGIGLVFLAASTLCLGASQAGPKPPAPASAGMQKRWLFVWRDMSDPKEVDRMIARFPRAKQDGYNGVAFSYNVPEAKAAELRQAAKQNLAVRWVIEYVVVLVDVVGRPRELVCIP